MPVPTQLTVVDAVVPPVVVVVVVVVVVAAAPQVTVESVVGVNGSGLLASSVVRSNPLSKNTSFVTPFTAKTGT
jgi:hypothetical protein